MQAIRLFLGVISITAAPLYAAETASHDTQNSALVELCKAYAQEDGIATSQQASYLKECLAGLSELSEQVQSSTPSAEATPSVIADTKNSPEMLVQNELVEKPDPSAEELSAKK